MYLVNALFLYCCWSQGFCSKHEVKNYPLRERTEKQVKELNRVQNIRRIEMAASTVSTTQACGLDSD